MKGFSAAKCSRRTIFSGSDDLSKAAPRDNQGQIDGIALPAFMLAVGDSPIALAPVSSPR
jgi:hypothetical protein